MTLAVLAACILQVFRMETLPSVWLVVVDSLLVTLFVAGLFWRVRGLAHSTGPMPMPAIGAVTFLILWPLLFQFATRSLFAAGDANEVIMLLCVQNGALAAAALSPWRRAGGIAVLLSGFLVLFVTAISQSVAAYALAALFGPTVMWWLMGSYWDRLEGRFAAETRRQVPVRAGILAATVLLLVGGASLVGLAVGSSTIVLCGFMPTSGGNRWSDPYARAGVGDGDMLVAAKDHALSFGPVDSDIFLDSKKSSLYDAFNDVKGEPIIQKKRDRRIAVDQDLIREMEQKAAESQQSGKEFSTVRRMASRWRQKLEDRKANGMLYVVGKTPLHLVLAAYDHYDGVNWSREAKDADLPEIALKDVDGKPWITARRSCGYPIFSGTWQHAVKLINLETNRIPAPCHLAAWHMSRIDRPDFFAWSDDGIAHMPGRETIPQLTVIRLISHRMNLEAIREEGKPSPKTPSSADSRMASYQALDEAVDRNRLEEAVEAWTADVPEGWRQVEAIVEHLRQECQHDPGATAPEHCEDTVSHFLAAGRGPDYLFATTAAMMIRSLGYPARLVSGFYADPRKYDRVAGQTIVEDEDVHFWTEVCIDGHTWIPVEPTPGYQPPLTVLTWRQHLARAFAAGGRWLAGHVLESLAALAMAATLLVFRREVFDALSWVLWLVACFASTRRRVLWTVRLLEWRSWMAGRRRPANRTLHQWYAPFADSGDDADRDSLRQLLDLADWARYSPLETNGSAWPCHTDEIRRSCGLVSWRWTSRRIRRHRPLNPVGSGRRTEP